MLLSSLLEPQLAVGFLGHLVRAFSTAHSHIPREAKANMELLPSFPQQFPSSGYQPQIQPPEPLIRKVLGNVLKERTGGKKNGIGTQVVHSFINFSSFPHGCGD